MNLNSMYPFLLAFHSLVRWLVLASLMVAIIRAYRGWFLKKSFSAFDNHARYWVATFSHIQLVLGICLYFVSPIIDFFLHHYKDAVGQKEIRFFGMEHSTMMLTAIVVITIGAAKAKRKIIDHEKFKAMAIWFTISLLIIIISIPWEFSPLASRPYFRAF